MKRPSFQFYPADWRKDSGLRLCSLAARGLWIELMCIAHESEDYGKLKQNGRVFCHKTIGKLVGLSPQMCLKLLKELEDNRVFSRDEDGAIYSRRMVHDEHIRNIRAEAGSKGGNPKLLTILDKQSGKQKPTPSSSSSSSSSSTPPSGESDARGVWKEPTKEEVVEVARRASIPESLAIIWLNETCGRSITPDGYWTDRNGQPIHNWQRALTAWGLKWQENERQRAARTQQTSFGATSSAPSVWSLKQKIEAAQAELNRIRGNPENKEQVPGSWDRRLKPEPAAQAKELKAKIDGWRAQMTEGKEAA